MTDLALPKAFGGEAPAERSPKYDGSERPKAPRPRRSSSRRVGCAWSTGTCFPSVAGCLHRKQRRGSRRDSIHKTEENEELDRRHARKAPGKRAATRA